jgi:hypothetical protein
VRARGVEVREDEKVVALGARERRHHGHDEPRDVLGARRRRRRRLRQPRAGAARRPRRRARGRTARGHGRHSRSVGGRWDGHARARYDFDFPRRAARSRGLRVGVSRVSSTVPARERRRLRLAPYRRRSRGALCASCRASSAAPRSGTRRRPSVATARRPS